MKLNRELLLGRRCYQHTGCFQEEKGWGCMFLTIVGLITAASIGYFLGRGRSTGQWLRKKELPQDQSYPPILHMNKEWLRITLQSIGDGVIATDATGKIVFLNGVAESLTGWAQADATGRPLMEVFHIVNEHTKEPCADPVAKVLATGKIIGLANHTALVRKDGTEVVIADSAAPILDDRGKIEGVVLVFRDETDKRQMQEKLRISEETYRNLFHNAQVGLFRSRLSDGVILEANHQIAEMFGYASRDEFISDFIAKDHYVDESQRNEMLRLLNENGEVRHYEAQFRRKDGSTVWMLYSARIYPEESWLEGVMEDITSRVKAEEKLWHLSYHDSLTGLYNRTFLEEKMECLAQDANLSVIIGDVNGLKLVNDAFGHQQGDQYLVRIASILIKAAGEGGIVVRWGGDEFAIILPHSLPERAMEVMQAIRENCKQEACGTVMPSLALGMAARRGLDERLEEVINRAEDRMYRQKLMESSSIRSGILASLTNTLREKSFETEEHTERTRDLATALGKRIGLSESWLVALSLMASLHDIGKIATPDDILAKPGPLTAEEREIVKKHPEVGYRIIRALPDLAPIAEAILSHHEWWDGSGYPRGLEGEAIPLTARIIALVEAYDAMTHAHPPKSAMTREEAIEQLRRGAGSQFDPYLVEEFIQMIEDH
ncbi:MAG: PAS domain S-box protein [Firmicutes bacterium]|jgi:diguanylate cyclase (GGDEF)-like protein/PAS domain S-box-containing protein|nr:PAS domain S-box protein [Bacillota bacterium]